MDGCGIGGIMKYFLYEDEQGIYEKEGKNYSILECNQVVGERAEEFKDFENLEEAKQFFEVKDK